MANAVLPAPTESDTVPRSYALNLLELVARWGVAASDVLAGFDLTLANLEEPSGRLPLTTMNAITSRARELTGEPGLGFYLGMKKRVSMYGFLGFAMMSAGTVRECLELAVRFTPVLTSAVALRLHVDGAVASLGIEEQVDMGDVHDVATLSLVVGLAHIGTALTGRAIEASVDFVMPEPAYFPRFAHLLPRARFGQPATRVVFDAAALELPLATADRAAMRLAETECERALDALGYDAQLGGRVRRALSANGRFRSLGEVARELRVSPRTLSRQLGTQGLSFSELLDRERRERALALLSVGTFSLEDVTERLGYSTVPNFIRAFQRWTGTTPSSYRRWERKGGERSGGAAALRSLSPKPSRPDRSTARRSFRRRCSRATAARRASTRARR